jgi:hypothetical protein
MKKLAIFLAIMLIPFSAFALDTISDNDLSDVTGQAGVSIYTNSIQIVKTGITTTYIDYDDTPAYAGEKEFNIVTDDATTKIFFKGVDPLMIDIVDMNTLNAALYQYGLDMDTTDHGDTGVMILLPNAIEIRNYGTTKTYYSGAVGPTNEMIKIGTTGGTTTIQHADMTWGNQAIVTYIGATPATFLDGDLVDAAAWRNSGTARMTTLGSHSDQIAIIITAHEDE